MRAGSDVFNRFLIDGYGNFQREDVINNFFFVPFKMSNDIKFFRLRGSDFIHINTPFGKLSVKDGSVKDDLMVDFFWYENSKEKYQVYAVLSQNNRNYTYYGKVVDANIPVSLYSFERVKNDYDINGVFDRIFINGWQTYENISDCLNEVVRCFRVSSEDYSLLFLNRKIKPNQNAFSGVFESHGNDQKIEGFTGPWSISWAVGRDIGMCLRVEGKKLYIYGPYLGTFNVSDFKESFCNKESESEQHKEIVSSATSSDLLNQVHAILLEEIRKTVSQSEIDSTRTETLIKILMKPEKYWYQVDENKSCQ